MKISELFTSYGSDKATEHSYGDFYDKLSESMEIKSILEVGVEAGYSMSAWKEKFPSANVVGLDKDVTPSDSLLSLHPIVRKKISRDPQKSGMLRHGDQFPPYKRMPGLNVMKCNAPEFGVIIESFRTQGLSFDLIIDDASHKEDDQVLTHHYLSEFLSETGVYVIEDLHNDELIKRMRRSGWEIIDLRDRQNRWDDVIAVKYGVKHGSK